MSKTPAIKQSHGVSRNTVEEAIRQGKIETRAARGEALRHHRQHRQIDPEAADRGSAWEPPKTHAK